VSEDWSRKKQGGDKGEQAGHFGLSF
jgi:hypothetical protein